MSVSPCNLVTLSAENTQSVWFVSLVVFVVHDDLATCWVSGFRCQRRKRQSCVSVFLDVNDKAVWLFFSVHEKSSSLAMWLGDDISRALTLKICLSLDIFNVHDMCQAKKIGLVVDDVHRISSEIASHSMTCVKVCSFVISASKWIECLRWVDHFQAIKEAHPWKIYVCTDVFRDCTTGWVQKSRACDRLFCLIADSCRE